MFQRFLQLLTPRSGRLVNEAGALVNEADVLLASGVLEPSAVVLRKQGYFFQDLREDVASGNVYHYRLKAPADKHLAVYVREITAGEGPVRFETVVQPSSFTPGTTITPVNLYTGGPAAAAEVEKGVVPTGGVVIPADFAFGAGNKQSTAGGSAALPTVLPPGVEIFARITNESAGVNPGIRFALAFAELALPDVPVIS